MANADESAASSREEKEAKPNHWDSRGGSAVVMPWAVPTTPVWIVVALIILFVCSVPLAQHGYCYHPRRLCFWLFLPGHAAAAIVLGWYIWPRLKLLPSRVIVRRREYEFRIENQTEDDAYSVIAPISVGSEPEDEFDLHLWPPENDARPSSATLSYANEFSYWVGKHHDKYLVVNLPSLRSHESNGSRCGIQETTQ